MLRRTACLVLPLALVAACGDRANPTAENTATTPAAATPRADGLVGVWSTDAPAEFQGEGLRTRVTDGLTAYDSRNRFAYRAGLTIFGPRLPNEGMNFAVAGTGTWARDGDRLTEDYTSVTVTPEHEDGELRRLATQLATELQDAPRRSAQSSRSIPTASPSAAPKAAKPPTPAPAEHGRNVVVFRADHSGRSRRAFEALPFSTRRMPHPGPAPTADRRERDALPVHDDVFPTYPFALRSDRAEAKARLEGRQARCFETAPITASAPFVTCTTYSGGRHHARSPHPSRYFTEQP